MPLESATYLNQLNPSNPPSSDQMAQGDDHLRLLKAVLQSTFPNITGPVTATQDDLNTVIPVGIVVSWYGTADAIPDGWALCNGSTVALSDGSGTIATPDLRDRVVIGAGTIASANTTTGAATATATTTTSGSHTHSIASDGTHSHTGVTIGGTALTVSQLPAHKHLNGVSDGGGIFTRGTGPAAISTGFSVATDSGSGANEGYSETIGSGATHNHSITFPGTDGTHSHTPSTDPGHTHSVTVATYQPALALHFIMKV